MKVLSKFLAGAFVLAMPLTSFAGAYKLTGKVAGLPDNTVIALSPISHFAEKNIAEIPVVNGEFSFEGTVDQPTAVWMLIKDIPTDPRAIVLEDGEINVSGEAKPYNAGDKAGYNLRGIKVTGSSNTDKFDRIYGERGKLNDLYNAYHEKYASVSEKMGKARASQDDKAIKKISESEDYKAMAQAEHDFFQTVEATYTRIINENKDTFWGPLMMISLFSYLTPDQREMYDSLSDEAKNSYYGKKVYEELYPAGKIGQQMPDFAVTYKNENTTFHKLCDGKKVVILDFWASWCRPCRAEIPHLKAIYEKHKNNGLDIVSVSIDDDNAAWEKALAKENMPWHNFRDADDNISALYKVRAVPQMYVVDSKGILIGENLRGEELAAKIDEILSVK